MGLKNLEHPEGPLKNAQEWRGRGAGHGRTGAQIRGGRWPITRGRPEIPEYNDGTPKVPFTVAYPPEKSAVKKIVGRIKNLFKLRGR